MVWLMYLSIFKCAVGWPNEFVKQLQLMLVRKVSCWFNLGRVKSGSGCLISLVFGSDCLVI